jgi:hypothetical protein
VIPGNAILRNVHTGDRGYLVRVDGKERVRDENHARTFRDWPYKSGDWVEDNEARPLSRFAVAMVAFEADKALCKLSGDPGQSYREWPNLTPEQRIAWRDKGPSGNPLRQKVFQAIKAALAEHTQE